MQLNKIVLAAALAVAPNLLNAQFDFQLAGRNVQIHSFASQGFAHSNDNNYLTMKTSDGSFAFTDGGANVSMAITDKFRVGAQAYARNIGKLGDYNVGLDYAFADYRFKDWFGVRGGKVKTALGLFNDTQDTESLHTWAILPQSMYPLDLRANTIAHTGADVYGQIPLHKAGSLAYTAYIGVRPDDPRGGYYYGATDSGVPIHGFSGRGAGGDVRWTTPVPGLTLGASWANETLNANGAVLAYGGLPYIVTANPQQTTAVYGDYVRGKWHFNSEFRAKHEIISAVALGAASLANLSDKGWFGSAAYRVANRLELGTYHSRYNVDSPQAPGPGADHIYDQTVTARFDITKFWDVKAEGHFIDGYGDLYSAHGFYLSSNTGGFKPQTKMLILRFGFSF